MLYLDCIVDVFEFHVSGQVALLTERSLAKMARKPDLLVDGHSVPPHIGAFSKRSTANITNVTGWSFP